MKLPAFEKRTDPLARRITAAADFTPPIEFEGIIAISLPMRAVIRRIIEAAAVEIPVLITGETGTGKELVASAIHKRSRGSDKPISRRPVYQDSKCRQALVKMRP